MGGAGRSLAGPAPAGVRPAGPAEDTGATPAGAGTPLHDAALAAPAEALRPKSSEYAVGDLPRWATRFVASRARQHGKLRALAGILAGPGQTGPADADDHHE